MRFNDVTDVNANANAILLSQGCAEESVRGYAGHSGLPPGASPTVSNKRFAWRDWRVP